MPKQRRACDACYKRKIQCDLSGLDSRCNWCAHHDNPCTFDRIRGRKKNGSQRNAFRTDMAERIARIEDAIANVGRLGERDQSRTHSDASTPASASPKHQDPSFYHPVVDLNAPEANPQPPQHTVPPSCMTSITTLGKIYFGGCYLGAINSQNTMPSLSEEGARWVFSATGEWPSLPTFDDFDSLARQHRFACPAAATPPNHATAGHAELPDIWVARSLLDQFLDSDLSHVFPIVDPALFRATMAQAYSPHREAELVGIATAKASVFAFLAFAGLHFPETVAGSYIDTDACAAESQALASGVLEDSSLTHLQATIFLLLYHTSSGRLRTSSLCHGIAVQTVFVLGGHTMVPPSPLSKDPSIQQRQDIQLRNMFWLAYVVDKEIALRSGQPPIIHDEYCNLSLPPGYVEQYSDTASDGMNDAKAAVPKLPGDIRLSILKSKTCRILYSVEASHKSDVQLLRSIRELDEELENWRASIPGDFAPALSRTTRSENGDWGPFPGQCAGRNVRRIMLNLEYHHLMTIIHSASGRCMKPPGGTASETRVWGLQSSLELSVEASRATLTHLGAAADKFPAEAFWFLIFYPMSAQMTLFFNILRDPLYPEARRDVELLGSVGALIRIVSARQRLARHDAARVESLDRFIKELCRLGECAIARAQESPRT